MVLKSKIGYIKKHNGQLLTYALLEASWLTTALEFIRPRLPVPVRTPSHSLVATERTATELLRKDAFPAKCDSQHYPTGRPKA